MTPPAIRPRAADPARPIRRRVHPLTPVGVLAALAALLATLPLVASPTSVPRIVLRNPTSFDLSVEVTDAARDGWMPMWSATRDADTIAEEIYDLGDTWIFRFSAQGETSSELRMTREELERSGWRVPIPSAVGDELRELGAPPQPD